MKKMLILSVIVGFLLSGCTAAQQGATLGGLAGMAGSALGKGDRKTTAIIGGVGSAVGYMIGNEVDKSNKKNQSQINNQQSNPGSPRTDCRKITTRNTRNGVTTVTVEETCSGRKTTYTY